MRKRATQRSTRKSFVNVLMETASLVKLSAIAVSKDSMERSVIFPVVERLTTRPLMMTTNLVYMTTMRILTHILFKLVLLVLAFIISPPVRRDSMWEVIRS